MPNPAVVWTPVTAALREFSTASRIVLALPAYEERHSWYRTDKGVFVNDPEPKRSKGKPVTVQRIKDQFGKELQVASAQFGVDVRVIAAVCATESRGQLIAERYEAGLHDWSYGPMQILTKTAESLAKTHTQLRTPTNGRWQDILCTSTYAFQYGAAYLATAKNMLSIDDDPILLYAVYNAGGLYASTDNLWGLRVYGNGLDRMAAWYGDACEVFSGA